LAKSDSQGTSATKSAAKLFGMNMFIETAFYLPNRFRQSLMANSAKISFETSEQALLGLMSEMFNLGETTSFGAKQGFSIMNFLQCYRHFFRSTMLYESISLSFRTLAYENLKGPTMQGSDWALSFGIGAFT
jgi:hypothetical protein